MLRSPGFSAELRLQPLPLEFQDPKPGRNPHLHLCRGPGYLSHTGPGHCPPPAGDGGEVHVPWVIVGGGIHAVHIAARLVGEGIVPSADQGTHLTARITFRSHLFSSSRRLMLRDFSQPSFVPQRCISERVKALQSEASSGYSEYDSGSSSDERPRHEPAAAAHFL